jgi:agarase
MKYLSVSFLAVCLFVPPAHSAGDYDAYGGWLKIKGDKTGYFHTQKIEGRWWLITPDGNAFFSKGVDNVSFAPESDHSPKAPDDPAAWAKTTSRQLHEWNFNTAGAWSTSQLYTTEIVYAPVINMAAAVQRDVWLKGGVVDYFSAEFRDAAGRVAERLCAPHAKDPWLLAYFTDNELRWGRDWRSGESLIEGYLKMAETSAGFRKASEFLRSRGHAASELNDDDKTVFLGIVAAEYGRVTSEAIRRHDPNHLILGCRFAMYPGDVVMQGVGPYFDVISFHSYSSDPPVERLQQITRITGKPVMVTEFSFKAMDSGLPNTKGAARPVATQQDRADGFARYVRALAGLPNCVGFHWFEYRDEPKEGRLLDGENSNYGLVRIDFTPWETLTARMREVNAEMESVHARSQPEIRQQQ